jgi:hypothetical protein
MSVAALSNATELLPYDSVQHPKGCAGEIIFLLLEDNSQIQPASQDLWAAIGYPGKTHCRLAREIHAGLPKTCVLLSSSLKPRSGCLALEMHACCETGVLHGVRHINSPFVVTSPPRLRYVLRSAAPPTTFERYASEIHVRHLI